MKLKLNKNKFKKHIEKVIKALPSTTALPSLYGILFKTNGSLITMITSDGNLSIKEDIQTTPDLEVVIPGDCLIPGRMLKDIISKQSEEFIIEVNDMHATITSNNFEAEVNLLNINDFPKIDFDILGKEIIIDSETFQKTIKNVSFAAADNDRRLILNGVNLIAENGYLTATATNSFRLAQEKFEINSNTSFNITILSKNLKEFLPENVKGNIIIKVDNTKVLTTTNGTTTLSKLIDGIYPEVEKLIPKDFNYILRINSKDLNDLIDRAIVVSDSEKKIIRMSINNDEITVESRKKEMGSSIVKTTNFNFEGNSFVIPFNAQFLKDALSKFKNEVKIMFVGENKPFAVKNTEDDSIIQLILPHRNF